MMSFFVVWPVAAVNHINYCAARKRTPHDEQMKKLPVRVGETGLVRLGKPVEFETLKTVEPIQHDDGLRRAALMVNLGTRDIEGFVREAERRIQEQVKLPENYIVIRNAEEELVFHLRMASHRS